MNIQKKTGILLMAVTTAAVTTSQANATIWNYTNDAANDSLSRGSRGNVVLGGTIYEFFGIAIGQDAENIWVAINSNLGLSGTSNSDAADGNIGYGDIFFNFPGSDFNSAVTQNKLYGIHFAPGNNSGVPIGIYSNVIPKSVASENNGYYLQGYYNTVSALEPAYGNVDEGVMFGDLSKEDFSSYMSYQPKPRGQFQPTPNVIASGKRIGDFTSLSSSDLMNAGLDLGQFSHTGSQVFGFKFNKSGFGTGDFIAHLFANCNNDGIANRGTISQEPPKPEPVPGSSTVPGLLLTGLVFGANQLYKSRKANFVN